ncbi:glycosyltransferase 8 domain-containing protein 1 isoform X1 [Manis pentadactyla]|uniref:glycosyltransferase 8 domain-containing protein 1 isoform X1 n=2 Tax=Manis pentadactyla TaxID=143292 RepID=UPI00255D01EA|nr:glycosyltransferase 8 domain-containing protein 1 isoform X1 [Manis pentadactyla]
MTQQKGKEFADAAWRRRLQTRLQSLGGMAFDGGLTTNIYIRLKRKMSFRKVNVIILVLAVAVFLLILHHNFLGLSSLLRNEVSDSGIVGLQPIDFVLNAPQHGVDERQEEIPVVIAASEDRLGGAVAAINSIQHNTHSNVIFYIVTLNSTADHLRSWLSSSTLKSIRYKIVNFDTKVLEGKVKEDPDQGESMKPLTFARFYLPSLVPRTKKVIYVDDDVIVQGDILALYNTPLKPGHAAAFSEDCDSASTKVIIRGAGNQYNYIGYLDYKKERIRKLSMKASTCSFNPGVFVANLTEWKRQNITNQLEKWMKLNVEEGLYSRTLAASSTTPPLLIVFYQQHSAIDPMWNVRHLGSSAGKRYSPQFVKAAKLLHWNGHFKPWGRAASYTEVWEKWYVPDPTGKFSLIRRHMEISNIK